MSFLNFENQYFLITGVNNKKSVAFLSAKTIQAHGGHLLFSVQNEKQEEFVKTKFPESPVFICDVSKDEQIQLLANSLKKLNIKVSGFLHSMAFARFSSSKLNEISFEEFSEAIRISAFSLSQISENIKDIMKEDASVVTVSISNLRATNYGYMGPIKAMLESSIDYLAKSFSQSSKVRFNAVAAGPLKTSASAGIPGYVDNYLFAQKLTLRKEGLKTQEVANSICFLLSNASSGINASTLTIDAGMNANYFDEEVVFNQKN